MSPAHPPRLSLPDYVGPVVGAAVFMGFVQEPARRTVNAVLVAGATGAYISGDGFGVWEDLMDAPSVRDAIHNWSRYRRLATPP